MVGARNGGRSELVEEMLLLTLEPDDMVGWPMVTTLMLLIPFGMVNSIFVIDNVCPELGKPLVWLVGDKENVLSALPEIDL